MTTEQLESTELATQYETLRRREYELITNLLDLFPKIDGLESEQINHVRDALFHADHPYLIVFVGPFSSGKSSLINALIGKPDLLAVGVVPTTDEISILRYGEQAGQMRVGDTDTIFADSPLLRKVSFVDTPGLESVFQKHEETTRKFLHRSDTVLLVMLATQAMTARNLEYLRILKEYGKNVIIVINQADLLSDEEAVSVRDYVAEQSQQLLGTKPEIWLVSARDGIAARESGDAAAWEASGLAQIERYIDEQLGDVARLRQKLQTPLQIVQSTTSAALASVRNNQSALDHYQNIRENIEQQLSAQQREQERIVREINDEVSVKFGEATQRGSEAIRGIFQLNRAFGTVIRAILELVGLGNLARRGKGSSYIRTAFEAHKAFEPINQLPEIAGKLGPRLEGKDVQDLDDLVKYGRREVEALPVAIREKVIGTVQAPIQYDRNALLAVRSDLDTIENEARTVETDKLETALRNSLIVLAAWELIVLLIGVILIITWGQFETSPELTLIAIAVVLSLAALGLVFLPLRGRMLENAHTNRMLQLQARYIEAITRASDRQIAYGMTQRRDVVAPLTRLIEAQTQTQMEQLGKLQAAQTELNQIETDLTALGKRRVLGITL